MKKIYLLFLSLGFSSFCFAQPVLIDDFSTSQTAEVNLQNEVAMNTQDGAGILGGERDIHLIKTSVTSAIKSRASLGANTADLSNPLNARSVLTIIYDGDDNDANLTPNTTGLGGVNVQTNGSAFLLDVMSNDQNANIMITLFSGAGNSSSLSINVPANTSPLIATFPFNGFTTASGAGANLTNVTAIVLELTGDVSLDMGVGNFTTNGTSVLTQGNTAPIPSMSQWGLFIFGLLVLNLGLWLVRQKEIG